MRAVNIRSAARLSSNTVQRRVTSTRREMYRQLAPVAKPVSARLLAGRDSRLAQLGPGCVYCGGHATGLDHIEPLVSDGMPTGLIATALDMLPCCGSCNSSKGASTWQVYMRRVTVKRSHARRVKWLRAYDRWRRRHAQRWRVKDHADTIEQLNRLVDDSHAFMQSAVNRAVHGMHGQQAMGAHARPMCLDWSSIDEQIGGLK